MSFRRFVYLVTDDISCRSFSLRRIDMSRFFLPKAQRGGLPPPLEEAELPRTEVKFDPPTSVASNQTLEFMLFPSGDSGRNDKVVVSDLNGRVILYDTESRSIRSMPSFSAPKFAPISMAVGNSHYILDRDFTTFNNRLCCFDSFSHDDVWNCHSLPPPPYVYTHCDRSVMTHVESYAVVGSNIWISNSTLGTHCFDTASCVWTKAGDWTLPFYGHVQYVPEHKLWFGIPSYGYCDGDDGSICTSDLTVTPPTIRNVWGEDLTPAEWTRKFSYLVHLGQSKFCHARFFETKRSVDWGYCRYAVFTGMEVEQCGDAGGELRVVKHRSEQYRLIDKLFHWVL